MSSPDDDTGGKIVHHLDEPECWARVERAGVGRLAVVVGRQPDIFPVNYVLEERDGEHRIVIRTAPGTKLAAAILGGEVAFEVDDIDLASETGWSVVVQGTTAEVTTLDDVLDAEALGLKPWAAGHKDRYLHIRPTRISGRQLTDPAP